MEQLGSVHFGSVPNVEEFSVSQLHSMYFCIASI